MEKAKTYAKKIIKHPLFSGSMIMIIGSNLTNVFAYIYHFLIGRMLGPSSYSELSSVIGILTIIFTTFTFLSTVIVKFVSAENSESGQIFLWFKKRVLTLGVLIFIAIILVSPFISGYLKVDIATVILIAPITLFAIVGVLYRSFIQGKLKFKEVAISSNIDIVVRLMVSVLAVYFGAKVFGAVFGIFAGVVVGVIYLSVKMRLFLKDIRKEKELKSLHTVLRYSLPVFVTSLSTNFVLSMDVIMVKHFFNPHDAGIYASLSTLGRVILYAAGPVGTVMFPLISKNHANGKKYLHFFFLSSMITAFICVSGIIGYAIFPKLAIQILFGSKYIEGAQYLVWFALFISLFTLTQLFISLFLSINKTKITYVSLLAVAVQFLGINLFHDTILQVIRVSTFASALLLIILVIYFLYTKTNEEKSN